MDGITMMNKSKRDWRTPRVYQYADRIEASLHSRHDDAPCLLNSRRCDVSWKRIVWARRPFCDRQISANKRRAVPRDRTACIGCGASGEVGVVVSGRRRIRCKCIFTLSSVVHYCGRNSVGFGVGLEVEVSGVIVIVVVVDDGCVWGFVDWGHCKIAWTAYEINERRFPWGTLKAFHRWFRFGWIDVNGSFNLAQCRRDYQIQFDKIYVSRQINGWWWWLTIV